MVLADDNENILHIDDIDYSETQLDLRRCLDPCGKFKAVNSRIPRVWTKRNSFIFRYNISTDDYDPWNTDSKSNNNPWKGVQSPVQNNPAVEIGAENQPLRYDAPVL